MCSLCVLHELKYASLCHRCWLSVDNHFIWSFIGPVTFIIMVSCFISLWILRLTDWGRAWEAEMKKRDRGSEMLEPQEKSARFFAPQSTQWWQVNFAPRTDFMPSHNPPWLSAPDKDQDWIVYFNPVFTQCQWSLTLPTVPNGPDSVFFCVCVF